MSDFNLLEKIILWISGIYSLLYIFIPHEYHLEGVTIDGLLANAGLINEAFAHSTHMMIGVVSLLSTLGYVAWKVYR